MAGLIVILAGIKIASSIVVVFLFGILIAQCMQPMIIFLRRWKIPSMAAIIITVLSLVVMGFFVILVTSSAVKGIRHNLPTYTANFAKISEGLIATLESKGIDVHEQFKSGLDMTKVQGIALVLIGVLAGLIGNGVFILILAIVILLELERIRKNVESGTYGEDSYMRQVAVLNKTTSTYIGVQALIGVIQGVLSVGVLLILGVDFAATWGILFFFLNFVPAVGFPIAVIMPTLIAWLEKGGTTALIVFVSWYAINIIFDNVVRPKLLKSTLEISFIAILFVLMFWTFILGPSGAILAIPLSLSLKTMYDAFMMRQRANEDAAAAAKK